MNGFIISNVALQKELKEYGNTAKRIKIDSYEVCCQFEEKFPNDKVFSESDDDLIVLDAVILNAKDLKKEYDESDMAELCRKMLKKNGTGFHSEFIGQYAGAVYNKDKKEWTVFANKMAMKQMFYYSENGVFIVASLITDITDTLKKHKISYTFNNDAAYLMLNYGSMGTNDTFVKEIKRIGPGHQVVFDGMTLRDEQYHRFNNNKYDLSKASEEEIIEGIDERFRRAIKREYDKDYEAGYNCHFRSLTGGTDSRACAFVAHDLGYKNTINYTYGVPEHPDEVIARQISKHLGTNFIYRSNLPEIGGAGYLYNIDESVYKSQGLYYYYGVAQVTTEHIDVDK